MKIVALCDDCGKDALIIYGDGTCIQTAEVTQGAGDQQEYTLNLTPYLSRGKSSAYSAVVYSIS